MRGFLLLLARGRVLLLEPSRVVALVRDSAAAVRLEDPAGDVVEYRSCVTATTVPAYSAKNRSSHATDSASRWFVGSSRSRRSRGGEEEAAGATRRRCPDSVPTSRSPSGGGARPWPGRARHRGSTRRDGRSAPGPRPAGPGARRSRRPARRTSRDLVEAVEQVALLADAVLDVAADVLVAVEVGLLGEQAYCGSGRELGAAARRLFEPGHDPEERGLPGAVRPETPIFAPGRNASVMSSSTLRSGP